MNTLPKKKEETLHLVKKTIILHGLVGEKNGPSSQ